MTHIYNKSLPGLKIFLMPNLLEEDSMTLIPQSFPESHVQIFQKLAAHGIIPTS